MHRKRFQSSPQLRKPKGMKEMVSPEEAIETAAIIDREPGVITTQLIHEAIEKWDERWLKAAPDKLELELKMQAQEEKMRFQGLVKLPLQCIEVLHLEFYNILRIDHLWMCNSLKILNLSNNIIEKIENLSGLNNLEELNLSFNHIKKIENLNGLPKLERLSLFSNKILKLENLEPLIKSLQMLSIGKNLIGNAIESLTYLRQFKQIRVLNFKDNPCEKNFKMKWAVAGIVPQCVYYNYSIILKDDRENGQTQHKAELAALEQKEAKAIDRRKKEKHSKKLNYFKLKMCIDGLEGNMFFKKMMEADPEGTLLMSVNKRIKEVFFKLNSHVSDVSSTLCQHAVNYYKRKMKALKSFMYGYETCLGKSLANRRVIIRDFTNKKYEMLSTITDIFTIKSAPENYITETLKSVLLMDKEFTFMTRRIWWELMAIEMFCFERNQEVLERLEIGFNNMVKIFVDQVHKCFTKMRDGEADFHTSIFDQINKLVAEYLVGEETLDVPRNVKKVIMNKETLNNYITTSHEAHLMHIDNKEEDMLTKVKVWQKKVLSKLREIEIQRNRLEIIDINEFITIEKKSWENQNKSSFEVALKYLTKVEPVWTNDILRLKMTKEQRRLDDKMQIMLTQRSKFDKKERVRRDKTRIDKIKKDAWERKMAIKKFGQPYVDYLQKASNLIRKFPAGILTKSEVFEHWKQRKMLSRTGRGTDNLFDEKFENMPIKATKLIRELSALGREDLSMDQENTKPKNYQYNFSGGIWEFKTELGKLDMDEFDF